MSFSHLGIALGGGGARGAAHIGVLQALQKYEVKIETISGVSAGSVIGAMYAIDGDANWVESHYKKILHKYISSNDLMNSKNSNSNSVKRKEFLKKVVSELLPVNTFEELKISLKVCVTDLNSAKNIVYDSGDLIDPLIKSCSIPGVLEPTIEGQRVLVDGGILSPIPVSVLKNCCEFIIAVNISNRQYPMLDSKSNLQDLKQRADLIISNRLNILKQKEPIL